MRQLLSIVLIVFLFSISSCRKDFEANPSFGALTFSKDTLFLDTIFTNIGSSTYNLKVYNNSNSAITVPRIELENGSNSNYRLNVDGIAGKTFDNIDILAKDSIFIFVETTINFNSVSNPLYTDRILFDVGSNQQTVDLVTLVQDAHFIFPDRNVISMKIDSLTFDGKPTTIKGRFLENSELTFTSTKPTVIYGYAAVPANTTLTIEAGAKVYFHNNSGLIVDKNASLKVNGTLNEKVVFEGDRLENSFGNIPGQWGTIWLRAGSKNHEINHAQIKNGIIGILIDSIGSAKEPTLTIKNSEIYNQSNFGILARETNIEGHNLVIGNVGQSCLAATIGGTYNFSHSTFGNYWNRSLRQLPAVLINNFFTFSGENGEEFIETRELYAANFTNCIIEGNNNIELIVDNVDGNAFNYNLKNCLIQFNDVNSNFAGVAELDFTNVNYQNIILNGTPNFRNTALNNFIIGADSDAVNKADTNAAQQFPLDILEVTRTINPDIGAYQHIQFN